eukprot:TRINITY_DN1856_c0_g2_i1.p1 TRINITY_DN1856_c0_g2~~TRINITY_DN1856_c0_g2_i1.p1  ORF type:complete len:345 (-),score=37.88 TRINITY_DN1856_c0_g2_i1:246-1280(-)
MDPSYTKLNSQKIFIKNEILETESASSNNKTALEKDPKDLSSMIEIETKKLESTLKSKNRKELKEALDFFLETPEIISSQNHRRCFNNLRHTYLGRIVGALDDIDGSDSNLQYVSTFIHDSLGEGEKELVKLEGCLYGKLPYPWNHLHSSALTFEKKEILDRLGSLPVLEGGMEDYISWRSEFMREVGALNTPVAIKIGALNRALKEPLRKMTFSYIDFHGYSFFTYYLIIKEMEKLLLDPKLEIANILKDMYSKTYGLKNKKSILSFACSLKRIIQLMEDFSLNNLEDKILKKLYETVYEHKKADFLAYCTNTRNSVTVHAMYKWILEEIQKASRKELDSFFK